MCILLALSAVFVYVLLAFNGVCVGACVLGACIPDVCVFWCVCVCYVCFLVYGLKISC